MPTAANNHLPASAVQWEGAGYSLSTVLTNDIICQKRSNKPMRRVARFYRAMLCIRGTSHDPVSVHLSVTSRSSTKTAKRMIAQTTPHDSPGTLVPKISATLDRGHPLRGRQMQVGWVKIGDFRQIFATWELFCYNSMQTNFWKIAIESLANNKSCKTALSESTHSTEKTEKAMHLIFSGSNSNGERRARPPNV